MLKCKARYLADLFNQLYEIDPRAASDLVSHRVECNKEFLESNIPFVFSSSEEGLVTMGVVGFINALAENGSGVVAAIYDDNQKLLGFTVTGCDECEPYQHEGYHL